MNIHKNARTTPYSRFLMARRIAAGEKIVKVAADFCVSPQMVRNWVQSLRTGGAGALQDRSSRLTAVCDRSKGHPVVVLFNSVAKGAVREPLR
jgi:transposase-like protein